MTKIYAESRCIINMKFNKTKSKKYIYLFIIGLAMVILGSISLDIVDVVPRSGTFDNLVNINCFANNTINETLRYSYYAYYAENSSITPSWQILKNYSLNAYYQFDTSSLPNQNISFRCDVYGNTSTTIDSFTSPTNVTIYHKNTFVILNPMFNNRIYPYQIWFAGVKCNLKESNNITLMAMMVDCNSDGNLDYYFPLNISGSTSYTSAVRMFNCINSLPGNYTLTATCVLTKNASTSWSNICDIPNNINYCGKQIYQSYEVSAYDSFN